MKKKVYITVGPPSIGKSSWIKANLKPNSFVLVSSDDATSIAAQNNAITYNQMFEYPLQENQRNDSGFYEGYTNLVRPTTLKEGWVDKAYDGSKGTKFITPLYSEYIDTEFHSTLGHIVEQGLSWKTWAPKAYALNNKAEIEAQEIFDGMVDRAKASNRDVVVDMTHMSQGARLRSLSYFEDQDVEKICVFFAFKGAESEIIELANIRENFPDDPAVGPKTIPDSAFSRMFKNFEPVIQDNFDQLILVDNRSKLRDFITSLKRRL